MPDADNAAPVPTQRLAARALLRRGDEVLLARIALIFAATVTSTHDPRVVEIDGTTDKVAWLPVGTVLSPDCAAADVVRYGLTLAS